MQGPRVSGHDDAPGDHPSADATDSSAAGPVSSAAPSPPPAAAGSDATAGNVCYLLWCSSPAEGETRCWQCAGLITYCGLHIQKQLSSMSETEMSRCACKAA